jgi:hypothetical protein
MLYLFIQNYFDVPVVPSINSKSNYPDDDLTPADKTFASFVHSMRAI